MSEPIRATLILQVLTTCPKCGDIFDLVEDTHLNEEGWVLSELFPCDYWSDAHADFECEVKCPSCDSQISISGVDW